MTNATGNQGRTPPRGRESGVQGWCQTHSTCQNVPEHSRMCQNVQDHPVLLSSLSQHIVKSRANRKESLASNVENRLPGQGCDSGTASLPITHKVLGLIPAWQDRTREQLPVSLSFRRAERIQFCLEQQEEAGGSRGKFHPEGTHSCETRLHKATDRKF